MNNYLTNPTLDAILGATVRDVGGQSCTTTSKDVSGLSDTERSELMVDRRSENSCSDGFGLDSLDHLPL